MHTDDRRSRAPQTREDDRGQRRLDSPQAVAHACHDSRASRARGPGRGVHVGSHEGRPGSGETSPLRRGLEVRSDPERGVACPSAARDGGPGRPRASPWNVGPRAVPLDAAGDLVGRPDSENRTRRSAGEASSDLARCLRACDRDGYPLVGWLDSPGSARGAGSGASRDRRSRRRHRICPRRGPRAHPEARSVSRSAPHTRPDDDGLEGARLVPRPSRSSPLRSQRQCRADRVVGRARGRRLVAAPRRRDRVPAARGRGTRAVQAVEAEAARVRAGSAKAASRLASCRRFSASWRIFNCHPDPQRPTSRPSAGRSPWRSRAAGSGTSPRRSGRASRLASASPRDTP